MIRINLIGEPTAPAAGKKRKRPEFSLGEKQGDILLVTMLVLSVIVVGVTWWLLSSRLDELRGQVADLKRQKKELQPFIEKVEELESYRATLQERIGVIKELKEKQRGPVRVMDEVSKALPDLVWLDDMRVEGTTVRLSGAAMDENAVANYLTNLDDSPFFAEPVLRNMNRGSHGEYRFSLSCTFTYSAEVDGSDGGAPQERS